MPGRRTVVFSLDGKCLYKSRQRHTVLRGSGSSLRFIFGGCCSLCAKPLSRCFPPGCAADHAHRQRKTRLCLVTAAFLQHACSAFWVTESHLFRRVVCRQQKFEINAAPQILSMPLRVSSTGATSRTPQQQFLLRVFGGV